MNELRFKGKEKNCTCGWERPRASGWQSLQMVLYHLLGAHNFMFLPGTYQNIASIPPCKSVMQFVIHYWQRPELWGVCEVLTCIYLSPDLVKGRRDSERPRRAEIMRADGHQHRFPEASEALSASAVLNFSITVSSVSSVSPGEQPQGTPAWTSASYPEE